MQGGIEQLYPFVTYDGEKSVAVVLNNRSAREGILELRPVKDLENAARDCAVYLFNGSLSRKECEAAGAGQAMAMANKYSPSYLKVPGNVQFTVWSLDNGILVGTVKVTDLDLC